MSMTILNNNINGVLYKQDTNEIVAECDNITIEEEKSIKIKITQNTTPLDVIHKIKSYKESENEFL